MNWTPTAVAWLIGLSHAPGMVAGLAGAATTAPAPSTGVPATRYPSSTVHTLPPCELSNGLLLVPVLWKSK